MKTGIQLPHFRPSTPATRRAWLTEIGQAADRGGFDSIWLMDHFFQLGGWLGEAEDEMLEGYTTLGYLAGVTEKIKIGLLVGGVIYRHPSIVVKMISTLDVLSGGRAYFGIGAAWYEHESVSLGLPFPPLKDRFEQLEEALQIAHQMFAGDPSPFNGHHYQLKFPHNNPQPLTQPHPPILIGGMGPKKTLRMVAQYGDACNFFDGAGDEVMAERLEILKGHCEALGRPYEEIEKTVLYGGVNLAEQSPAQIVDRTKELEAMGFEHVIYNFNSDYTLDAVETFVGDILPHVK